MEYITFKKSNCRNCHKCIRYCPVKSIRFSGNQANVISDECILCGECYVVCPQNAKQIADETEIVSVLLGSGAPVTSSREKATPEPERSPLFPKTICWTLTAVPQSSGMRLMRR